MSRWIVSFALAIGVFWGGAASCFKADVRVPDVSVNVPSEYGGRSSGERRLPYAKDLENVLERQRGVAKQLTGRDWEDLGDELNDWVKDARKLMGKADTSGDPAKMREYCTQLLKEMDVMQKAARSHDAGGVQAALARTDPWLNRLSAEFPLTEPVPDAQPAAPVAP